MRRILPLLLSTLQLQSDIDGRNDARHPKRWSENVDSSLRFSLKLWLRLSEP